MESAADEDPRAGRNSPTEAPSANGGPRRPQLPHRGSGGAPWSPAQDREGERNWLVVNPSRRSCGFRALAHPAPGESQQTNLYIFEN
ncbi:hypothetical protein NDU88_001496 [Pleurodeles waltl]|uniref:Uncharacterized protein n=1 Tax=Pleurodeles waltl TaxID=8319 RepID=A0AAV7LDB9_PLEWA|nr:hypothetical protein NDU88_001496 [Pleurodeles waltl]